MPRGVSAKVVTIPSATSSRACSAAAGRRAGEILPPPRAPREVSNTSRNWTVEPGVRGSSCGSSPSSARSTRLPSTRTSKSPSAAPRTSATEPPRAPSEHEHGGLARLGQALAVGADAPATPPGLLRPPTPSRRSRRPRNSTNRPLNAAALSCLPTRSCSLRRCRYSATSNSSSRRDGAVRVAIAGGSRWGPGRASWPHRAACGFSASRSRAGRCRRNPALQPSRCEQRGLRRARRAALPAAATRASARRRAGGRVEAAHGWSRRARAHAASRWPPNWPGTPPPLDAPPCARSATRAAQYARSGERLESSCGGRDSQEAPPVRSPPRSATPTS